MIASVLPLLAALAASAGEVRGWRYDGSGVWPEARPPASWSEAGPTLWSTPLPDWSNASPAVGGGKVCVAVEPTTLTCLDADTGAVAWSAPHPVAEAVGTERKAEVVASNARREAWEAELDRVRTAYGAALKQARSQGSAEAAAQAQTLARQMDALKAKLDAEPEYRTLPVQGMVGWSSPTPVTDGQRVYALFANGVVAAHDLATGKQLWVRWQGPPPGQMLGWEDGHSASPCLVDGVLVVPFARLTGLDAATGKVLWEGEPWPHYGGPTPLRVDGVGLVATPSGRLLRARDGVVLAKDLGDQWYVGPVAAGRDLVLVDARSDVLLRKDGGAVVHAWRIDRVDGASATVSKKWEVKLEGDRTFYTAPVIVGDVVHAVTHDGLLWTLDLATGAVLGKLELPAVKLSTLYASPTVADGRLFLTSEAGTTLVITPGRTPAVQATTKTWPMRASPAFVGGRAYLRTRDGVVAVGR